MGGAGGGSRRKGRGRRGGAGGEGADIKNDIATAKRGREGARAANVRARTLTKAAGAMVPPLRLMSW